MWVWSCVSTRAAGVIRFLWSRHNLGLPSAPKGTKLARQPDTSTRIWTSNLTCSQHRGRNMTPLTQYGRMAEKHWREHCPKMVHELERRGILHRMLLEAEEKTKDE